MIKNIFARICMMLLTVSFLSACSDGSTDTDVNDSLERAYTAMTDGRMDEALEICNRLTETADSSMLDWHDYCRAAAVYAAAYDRDIDTEASMASATKCVSRARALHPDSVELYINSLSHEYSGSLNTVIQTLDGLNTDRSTIGDHEEGDFVEDDLREHDGEESDATATPATQIHKH